MLASCNDGDSKFSQSLLKRSLPLHVHTGRLAWLLMRRTGRNIQLAIHDQTNKKNCEFNSLTTANVSINLDIFNAVVAKSPQFDFHIVENK